MTTIEISYKDLCELTGKKIPIKELEEEAILYVKGELQGIEGDTLKIEIADTNRPDLWSSEGIARELRAQYGLDSGVPKADVKKGNYSVHVDPQLMKIRPMISCAVIKDVKVTNEFIIQIVQLQEKVAEGFGRKRKEAAIGVYDFDKITWPVRYIAADPDKEKFVPLEFTEKMTLRQILSRHPKGRDYACLLEPYQKFPLLIDSANEVLSMPPVINSNHTGKITEKTKNLFVEVTGYDWNYTNTALLVMVQALADRGFKVESVINVFPDGKKITPDFSPKKAEVDLYYVNKRLGLELTGAEVVRLLKRARYNAAFGDGKIKVEYPAYRQDILHKADITEDIAISYGYNKFIPETPKLATIGYMQHIERFARKASEIMLGLGGQEVMNYTLTNEEILVKNMCLSKKPRLIEIENFVSKNWNCFRNSLLPEMIEFLSKNKNKEYPQQIFETGQVVLYDETKDTMTRNPVMLGWAMIAGKVGYTEARQALDYLLKNIGVEYKIFAVENDSFISGRAGKVVVKGNEIGVLGEINPVVLEEFGLEMPVGIFEINLSELMEAK
ncbi:phenylalanine--tRNA ligase subunit beta [Candidatus Woesearchaeota archaeon]|nr:phenylalanine--tRNA ligase subunit beta [Candidatus Woesearchaeota archaeon]